MNTLQTNLGQEFLKFAVECQAFKFGEAAAVAPMEYLRLLFATVIGVYYFSEIPTIWTLVGSFVIIASTLYTMHRNIVRKQKIVPDVPVS